ncbi:hypothetical protein CASFOL_006751 [Castilleja foliolosa]|uniref:Expansin n=1 Tax=Castilleja foliolosa TaxID=1961234 RepID=A0ABD3E7A5_9LAMI
MAVQRVVSILLLLLLLPLIFGFCLRARATTYNGGTWDEAHATCYESDATTMGGACGYSNVDTLGYGENTTAISYALFNDGYTCGACFNIKCNNDKSCKQSTTVTVTATNSCPSNAPNTPPWCNVPKKHFDLAKSMFITIAEYTAGVVPVLYRRVPCSRNGNIKFTFIIKVSAYFKLVLITNVGGAGDVQEVLVITVANGSSKKLRKNWGQHWQLDGVDEGQDLKFQVTTSDKNSVTSRVISNWKFGETHDGEAQFS